MPPNLEEYKNNPEYTVEEKDNSILVRKKPEQYVKNQMGDDIQKADYIPEEYTFSKDGQIIGGYRQELRVSIDRSNRYAEVPYKAEVYKAAEGGYEVLRYDAISKNQDDATETVKFVEREKYQYGERTERQTRTVLTPTQKENIEAKQKKVEALRGRYVDNLQGKVKPETPTTQAEFARSLFEKQGKQFEAVEVGGKIAAYVATPSKTAKLRPEFETKKRPEVPMSVEYPPLLDSEFVRKSEIPYGKKQKVTVGQLQTKTKVPEKRYSDIEKTKETFGERVKKFSATERAFYQKFSVPEYVGTMAVGTSLIAPQYKAKLVTTTLNIPTGLVGLALFTPRKAAFAGEALGYPEYRPYVFKEFLGAGRETLKIYDPRTPTGQVTYTFGAAGGILKGTIDLKTRGSTAIAYETTTVKPAVFEVRKVATVGKSIKGKSPLEFEYQRMQVLEKAIGREKPVTSLSKGAVRRGVDVYPMEVLKVGRRVYGTIYGKRINTIFQKTPKGKLQVEYLTKEGDVLFEKEVPFIKEELAIKREILKKTPREEQLDIGRAEGGAEAFSKRVKAKEIVYKATGKSAVFEAGRDIRKSFMGRAESRLLQYDTAGFQREVVKYGDQLSVTLKPADIQYAIQPKYKSTIKTYTIDELPKGVVPVETLIKRPELITKRETTFIGKSIYAVERSRIKRGKQLITDIGKALTGRRAELKLGKETIIQAPEPTLKPQRTQLKPPISEAEIRAILSDFEVPKEVPYALPTAKKVSPDVEIKLTPTPFKPLKEVKRKVVPTVQPQIKTYTVSDVKVQPEVKVQPRARTLTEVRVRAKVQPEVKIQPEVRVQPEVRARVRATTKTQVRTVTRVPTTTATTIGYPPTVPPYTPPPPIPPVPFLPKSNILKTSQAYDVLIRRRGAFKQIGKELPVGKALRLGATEARRTLAATFKLVPKGITRKEDIPFRPSIDVFREYKIEKRKKIPTPFQFIQRRGKRLATPTEVRELQSFRRTRSVI